MKKTVVIVLIFIVVATSLVAQSPKNDKDSAKIMFNETIYDYGIIEQGSDGLCMFTFRNEGEIPLILSSVRSTCGCTVPNWPKDPLGKGKKGAIKVKYNTARIGSFNKSITVYSNGSEDPIILQIRGKVVAEKM